MPPPFNREKMTNGIRASNLLGAALILFASGCSRAVEEPDVQLAGVRVGGFGLQGGLIYVELDVHNPNRFAFETDGLTYDFALREPTQAEEAWTSLAVGTFDESVRIDGQETRRVEIPVEFRYADAQGAFSSLLGAGTFDYRLTGAISLVSPIRREIPYRHLGTFSLGESSAENP